MRLIIFLLFISSVATGQRTLFLEQMTEIKPLKYYEGQTISVKLKSDKRWHSVRIETNDEVNQRLITDYGVIGLDDISVMRKTRNGAIYISNALYTYSAANILYGSILQLNSGDKPNIKNVAINSAISGGSAWLIQKLFRHKKFKIGRKNRLKIIDLTL